MTPPTAKEIEAACEAMHKFLSLTPLDMNDGEWTVHCFMAGFYRGLSYAKQEKNEKA
jgi:hypothetical protein